MSDNNRNIPLSERMRPSTIEDYQSQTHFIHIIKSYLKQGIIPSMIFWGPPGVGKTTLALIISQTLKRSFLQLSAINAGVKDIRDAISKAEQSSLFNTEPPILFIDEIHRFNKSQQDSLLAAVEKGTLILIGATTENPSFEVNSALLSRCQTYHLKSFNDSEIESLVKKAIQEDKILQSKGVEFKSLDFIIRVANGDARKALNAVETIVYGAEPKEKIADEKAKEILQENLTIYDKNGEMHYDIISAFIKSIRGSDPQAAVYWLARMIDGGEDPKFIARRLIISAAEDIGNANPDALSMANSCFDAVSKIGFPEARIILSQATTYLACSPKSNAAYMAINRAMALVKETGNLSVPLPLRNAPTQLMKEEGYGKGYKYSHDFPNSFVQQEFLPSEISGTTLYYPKEDNKWERSFLENQKGKWKNKYFK